jgi:thiamine biosynthesis lipoprotein
MRKFLVFSFLATQIYLSLQAQLQRFEYTHPQMGTIFTLIVYTQTEAEAISASKAVFAKVDSLNATMSDYNLESELSKLSAGSGTSGPVKVSKDLWEILVASNSYSRLTSGAFDVSIGPVIQLWRRARRKLELPSDSELQEARKSVGYQYISLDPENRTVELLQPHMRLDLGGIAQGYAADKALDILRRRGITQALLDAGGDIFMGNPPPGEKGWKIQTNTLSSAGDTLEKHTLLLSKRGVTTSGDTYRYIEIGGKRYSHIVDPAQGIGLTRSAEVTVIAPTCIDADALATALSVMGPEKGLALVRKLKGVHCQFIINDQGTLAQYRSRSFERFIVDRSDKK